MSDPYTKLFSSITESTIWSEPAGTRLVWITLLAKCDRHGEVFGSVPGLARLANVTLDECVVALDTFRSPDPWSRTPDNDGRRIANIDGGWRLLNHAKFDRMRSEAEAAEREKERKREWDRQNRPSGHARQSDESPTQSDAVRQGSDAVRAPSNTSSISKSKEQKQEHVQPPAARSRFDEFWTAYPNKKGKQEAEKTWRKRKLDAQCDALICHVLLMIAEDSDWHRGYVPMGSTYLNQARWEDVPKPPPDAGQRAGPNGVESKTLSGMKSLQGLKNGLVPQRNDRRADQADVLELGSNACRRLGTDHGGHVD